MNRCRRENLRSKSHILDEDRKKNAQLIEDAFYKKENLNPNMKQPDTGKKKIEVPDGIDAEALMKMLNNPEKAEDNSFALFLCLK